jgi:putative methyltransferase (TIGR04325 family)
MDIIGIFEKLERRSERFLGSPVTKMLTEHRYRNLFFSARGWRNLAYGAFPAYETAANFCRQHQVEARYNLDHRWWADVQATIKPHDYPVLFWLSHKVQQSTRVLDVGGSVGVSYYAYSKILPMLTDVAWEVLELPEAVTAGRELANERNCKNLSFVESWNEAQPADILLSAGAAQFLPEHIWVSLAALPNRPRCILINRTPIHPRESFVTLQNTGTSIAPCRVYAHDEFVAAFAALGYELQDEWSCTQNNLRIPYRPDLTLNDFRGFCFTSNEPASGP